MKVKLEIPTEDFLNWIKEIHSTYIKGSGSLPVRIKLRNQIVEEGNYIFNTEVCQGYSHDSGQFEEKGKVSFIIETSPPKD